MSKLLFWTFGVVPIAVVGTLDMLGVLGLVSFGFVGAWIIINLWLGGLGCIFLLAAAIMPKRITVDVENGGTQTGGLDKFVTIIIKLTGYLLVTLSVILYAGALAGWAVGIDDHGALRGAFLLAGVLLLCIAHECSWPHAETKGAPPSSLPNSPPPTH